MSVSDPLFLNGSAIFTIFLALFAYSLVPSSEGRRATILMFSVYFYLKFAGPTQLVLVLALALLTFACAKIGKKFLNLAIAINILGLIIAKYYLYEIATEQEVQRIWIPLGVSFFVFEFVHYLMEVKRGMEPESNFFLFMTFSLFFPTVVSGPIRRYDNFTPQVRVLDRIRISNLVSGLYLISIGFIYKFAADQFSNFQDKMLYYRVYSGLLGGLVFLFVISMKIFLDFAGYSYIAIGIARIIGIRIPMNFRAPYLSTSVIDFWNRWHISLSNWVRDYLYIPLGGSRVIFYRSMLNLIICMTVIGLWHGFGTRFLVWGILQGIGLTVNHSFRRLMKILEGEKASPKSSTKTIIKWCVTMMFVSLSWVFFFYEPSQAIEIIQSILSGKLMPW